MCVWQWASCLSIIDTKYYQAGGSPTNVKQRSAEEIEEISSHPANPPLLASHVARREVSLDRKSDTDRKDSIILKHLLIRAQNQNVRRHFASLLVGLAYNYI
jgi:hypothetical protein